MVRVTIRKVFRVLECVGFSMVTFGVELALGLNQTKAGRALNSLTIPMKYSAIATDYDGTLATEGLVDQATLAALQHYRHQGGRLLLVTGRALDELLQVFPHHALFHSIVAENGAVLYHPHQDSVTLLAEPFPPVLVETLTNQGGAAHQPGQSGSSNLATPRRNGSKHPRRLGVGCHRNFQQTRGHDSACRS